MRRLMLIAAAVAALTVPAFSQSILAPKVEGHIENVSPAHTGHGASTNVVFDDIVLADGRQVPANLKLTSAKAFEPKKHLFRDAGLVIGAAVVGTIVHFKLSDDLAASS